MTDTAFSKSLQKEVDPEQYMELKGLDEGSVHAVAREDVICPICKVGGGTFVRASRSEGITRKLISGLQAKMGKATIRHVISMVIDSQLKLANT